MKRLVSVFVLLTCMLTSLCGCSMVSINNDSIGKYGNTAVTVYAALQENMAARKKENFTLYGVRMLVNSENVGSYTYVYTDKRPDELNYSDILVVKVNNRTGKIEKFSSPDYATYGSEPYDMIKSAMPLDLTKFNLDSDETLKIASAAHFDTGLDYNYIDMTIMYKDGIPVYNVDYISLVGNCVYTSVVDAMTGTVVSTSVEDL